MSLRDQMKSMIDGEAKPSFWRRQNTEDLIDEVTALQDQVRKTFKKYEDTLEKKDKEIDLLRAEIREHYAFMQGVIIAVLESKPDAPKVSGAVAAYLANKKNGVAKPVGRLPG